MTRASSALCPHPTKRAYPTRAFALMVANRAQVKGKAPRLRAYKCRCRAWHLTSHAINGGGSESAAK